MFKNQNINSKLLNNREELLKLMMNEVYNYNINQKNKTNDIYLTTLNGLGEDQSNIWEINNWKNKIYKFNINNEIENRMLDNYIKILLQKMFSLHLNNNKYMTYISNPQISHHSDYVIINFDYISNLNNYILYNTDNINNSISFKDYLTNNVELLLNILIDNNNNNNNNNNNKINYKRFINLLKKYYKKDVYIKLNSLSNIHNNNEIYLKAYKEFKYNDSMNNTNILNSNKNKNNNNNIKNSFINKTIYNPSLIDDQYIDNIGNYYTQIYKNISNISNINDITPINIFNNVNINILDDTMTNKYPIGYINITKGKGANISAIGRSEYNKNINGSFINYSSKSHIKTIYNNKNNAYNTFTSLRNINNLNYKNNNTVSVNNFIIFDFGIEGLKYRVSYG